MSVFLLFFFLLFILLLLLLWKHQRESRRPVSVFLLAKVFSNNIFYFPFFYFIRKYLKIYYYYFMINSGRTHVSTERILESDWATRSTELIIFSNVNDVLNVYVRVCVCVRTAEWNFAMNGWLLWKGNEWNRQILVWDWCERDMFCRLYYLLRVLRKLYQYVHVYVYVYT